MKIEGGAAHTLHWRDALHLPTSHTLVDATPDVRLTEGEVRAGGGARSSPNCTNGRGGARTARTALRLHAEMLVQDIRSHVVPVLSDDGPGPSSMERRRRLSLQDGLGGCVGDVVMW